MKTHELKLEIAFCDAVFSGEKSFEVRSNDRGFQKTDKIKFTAVKSDNHHLLCNHPINGQLFEITYVLSGWGINDGYVVFSIEKVNE